MVSVDVGAFLSRIERLYADWEVSKEERERERTVYFGSLFPLVRRGHQFVERSGLRRRCRW